MTKAVLIDEIKNMAKVYGKENAGFILEMNFTNIGFYMEDKRRSKVQFAIDCINNCYRDNLCADEDDKNFSQEDYSRLVTFNRPIERAIYGAKDFLAKYK